MRHNCTRHEPGALACYSRHGCRCEPCRAAHSRSCKRAKVGLSRMVADTGTVRRLRALSALGWTTTELAAALGVTRSELIKRRAGRSTGLVQRSTAARVASVYNRLSMTAPPESMSKERARDWARLCGWPPPLAWDEATIDDPAAQPYTPELRTKGGHRDAVIEDVEHLVKCGEVGSAIARRIRTMRGTPYNQSDLARSLQRWGRSDLARAIDRSAA